MTEEKFNSIVGIVGNIFDIKPKDILSDCREHNIVRARVCVMVYLRKYESITLFRIGRWFNRHHSTVIHAISNHDTYMADSENYIVAYNKLIGKNKSIMKQVEFHTAEARRLLNQIIKST